MPIIVSNIRIGLNDSDEVAITQAIKTLGVTLTDVKSSYLHKKSLDARRRGSVSFVTSVVISLHEREAEIAKAISDPFVSYKSMDKLEFTTGSTEMTHGIIIVGFGPAGIFAADVLSKLGYKPQIFERGCAIDERVKAVSGFWKNGVLNEESNVQFGEGGAGAFSDGKLTTRISDNRCTYVLDRFVQHGAPSEITVTARPHIGTDKLRNVIKSMRESIVQAGATIHFNSKVTDIIIRDGKACGIVADGVEYPADSVILAVGHSSRDMFQLLYDKGVMLESKPFSVGVRIEQLQSTIDKGLYGDLAGHPALPKGEYQLSHKWNNKCVYTFCMCPGGFVVPSSSIKETVVVNGMSEHARDGKNANSALAVSVDSADFGDNPLDGMHFQQRLESLAYKLGGGSYKAPAMTVGEFTGNGNTGSIDPTYSLGIKHCGFEKLFPHKITDMLKLGLGRFNVKLNGFADRKGVLTGVETRTSSPIRILRNDELYSTNVTGLYPCGEGAGYAGGIMSAAVDGIRIAQQLTSTYKPN